MACIAFLQQAAVRRPLIPVTCNTYKVQNESLSKHPAMRAMSRVLACPAAEALFFGGSFSGKAPAHHFATQHDAAWHNAKIALISTVLWVPVAAAMIYVSGRTSQSSTICSIKSCIFVHTCMFWRSSSTRFCMYHLHTAILDV